MLSLHEVAYERVGALKAAETFILDLLELEVGVEAFRLLAHQRPYHVLRCPRSYSISLRRVMLLEVDVVGHAHDLLKVCIWQQHARIARLD